MHFDFATILVLATAVTGLIWALDAWLWAPQRQAPKADQHNIGGGEPGAPAKEPTLVEYAKAFFPVILIVLLLRSFLVEPFRIPSGSMLPTLLVGDFILVNKFAYGIRLPVVNRKIIEIGAPQRGDVAVFRFPLDPHVDYIKRIVALPGDRIAYTNKILYINGQPMAQAPTGRMHENGGVRGVREGEVRIEDLTGVSHEILVTPGRGAGEGEYVVPPGQYFAMGDNRDNSNDSRFWGPVPEENLVGKAFMIWMNWDQRIQGIGWDRIGESIH
jgi:signal peptidase I